MKNEENATETRKTKKTLEGDCLHILFENMHGRIMEDRAARHREYAVQMRGLDKAEKAEAKDAGNSLESIFNGEILKSAGILGLEAAKGMPGYRRHYLAVRELPQVTRQTESRFRELCRAVKEKVISAEVAQEDAIIATLLFRGIAEGKETVVRFGGTGALPVSAECLRGIGYSGDSGIATRMVEIGIHGTERERNAAYSALEKIRRADEIIGSARESICALMRSCRLVMDTGGINRRNCEKLFPKKRGGRGERMKRAPLQRNCGGAGRR